MIYNEELFSKIRADFPMMQARMHEKPLIYLDSAASAQKPIAVIQAMDACYREYYAPVHRGIYAVSAQMTAAYESVRETVRDFIKASASEQIVFVRGTTEGINFVASTLSQADAWQAGDEVILTVMEHHSNIVPWYQLSERLGIKLKVVPIHDDGRIDQTAYEDLFTSRTKLVALSHVSNVLGMVNPIESMIAYAKSQGVPVLIDGAQAAPHCPIDVTALNCDFYVFSGHKVYGPTGAGVLYISPNYLHRLPPYQGGGNMIETVSFEKITYAKPPLCFEAGTQDAVAVIGMGEAIRYVEAIGFDALMTHEETLVAAIQQAFHERAEKITIYGTGTPKKGVFAFNVNGVHAHDVGTILDDSGIAVRAGHHCAMPLMTHYQVPAMVRLSLGVYNTLHDIRAFFQVIDQVLEMFA